MIGLIININYKLNRIEKTFNINNIEEARIELVNYLSNEFNKLNIDFPLDYHDFEYVWCEYNNMDHLDNIFTYNIYDTNDLKWKKIWTEQEIYNDILDKINELDLNNDMYINKYYIDDYENIN
jgi:hypothetical protein